MAQVLSKLSTMQRGTEGEQGDASHREGVRNAAGAASVGSGGVSVGSGGCIRADDFFVKHLPAR